MKTGDTTHGGLLLHVASETPGESTSVIPKVKPGISELDLKTEKPPADGEWLDGDAFLYVVGDHVCLCSTGLREGAIAYFIRELFKQAKIRKDAIRFELLKAADISKIRLIHSQGVKELQIKAALYLATAEYESRKAHASGSLGLIGKHLMRILNKPLDVTPDGLRVVLALRADKRFGEKAVALGYKRIEAIATDVVKNKSNDEDYTIITKTGQKISPKEIFIRSKVLIDAKGKTVDRDKAWRELTNFLGFIPLTHVSTL